MARRPAILAACVLVVAAACGDGLSTLDTTTTTATTTTTTTTTMTSTTTTVPETTTTLVADTTTTTLTGDTTTTLAPDPDATTTTTVPPADADPDLIPWAGLFRQPAGWSGFLDFQANGVIRAGHAVDDLPIVGRWDYDPANDHFLFSDFDFGEAGCAGAEGRYARTTAPGGGRRITLVEDPCQARVDFIVQPGSTCRCFLYLLVEQG